MKKYIFLIISLIFIPFVVSAWMSPVIIGGRGIPADWLSDEWDKRIKLTVDNTKIDAALSHFPVTVILSSTHGDCVFDELTQDANRKKIAFTKSDGTTQLYGEIEKWDDANESAIIHVSLSGWSLSSSADTDFYMYYDVDHADNDTYIGDIDSTPGHSVWDSNFKFVCHMVDETTSAVKDSTSNGNDGTKKAANEPIEAVGKIGQGQDFDGNDRIQVAHSAELCANDYFTVECVAKIDALDTDSYLIAKCDDLATADDNHSYRLIFQGSNKVAFGVSQTGLFANEVKVESAVYSASTWYHLAGRNDGTNISLFSNTTKTETASALTVFDSTSNVNIGCRYDLSEVAYKLFLAGNMDEIRISATPRTDAWIKATYNTLWDTLLTYGSEEVL